jgi:hypothetical protein
MKNKPEIISKAEYDNHSWSADDMWPTDGRIDPNAGERLGYMQIKNDNPHMTSFTVGYNIENGIAHAIVSGFSPKFGNCRADYYFKNRQWVLGAN